MDAETLDALVRQRAFEFLDQARARHGEVLGFKLLERGFDFAGRRVPLLSQQGIFKPALLPEVPLSIRTAPESADLPRPYDDLVAPTGEVVYRYRGRDASAQSHRDNRGLRLAMERSTPLVYFQGDVPGRYFPLYPVFIVRDDPQTMSFHVAVDDVREVGLTPTLPTADAAARRKYITTLCKRRAHQAFFRERVVRAYRCQCAICRLKHAELLDAAHIVADRDEQGVPEVYNGLALCKLHHATFDQDMLGITPDCVVEIHPRILEEEDGPMLMHGLKGFHHEKIQLPRNSVDKPKVELLEARYARFRKTA
jgi:putative restriction endonuclease